MINTERLSLLQAILIIIISRLITAYTYLPVITTPPANQDMWIVILLAVIYTPILCTPLLYLSNRYESLTLLQYSEKILGRFAGKLTAMLYIAFLFFHCLLHLNIVAEFLGSAIMPETPPYATAAFMLVTCIYLVYKGLEPIGRVAEIFVPFALATIVLFTVLSIKDFNFQVFLPVFADSGIFEINYGALSIASRFSEVVILCMLIPNLKNKRDLNKAFYIALLTFTFFFAIITVSTQSVLGIEQAKHSNFPYFTFTSQVDVFDFIQRIESINVVTWFLGVFIKFSIYFYFASSGISQVLGVKSNKAFIIPMALIVYILALTLKLTKSVVADKILSYRVLPYISFFFIFGIPVILLIVHLIRKKL